MRQGRNQYGELNREIYERREKQKDEEISRGDAENAEEKNDWPQRNAEIAKKREKYRKPRE